MKVFSVQVDGNLHVVVAICLLTRRMNEYGVNVSYVNFRMIHSQLCNLDLKF